MPKLPRANIKNKVMVVEDSMASLYYISELLDEAGYEVIEATNGNAALEMLLEKTPDLILLDIVMPKMDGLTMLNNLREDAWGKDAQVIILTNLSGNGSVSQALNQGVYEYLVKTDIKIEDLVLKVKQHLGV